MTFCVGAISYQSIVVETFLSFSSENFSLENLILQPNTFDNLAQDSRTQQHNVNNMQLAELSEIKSRHELAFKTQ